MTSQLVLDSVLKKKSPKGISGCHAWQKRRFVLHTDKLTYGKPKSDKRSGVIPLETITDVKMYPSKNKGCRFDITLQTRTFALVAESREECADWVSKLQPLVQQSKEKKKGRIKTQHAKKDKFWKLRGKDKHLHDDGFDSELLRGTSPTTSAFTPLTKAPGTASQSDYAGYQQPADGHRAHESYSTNSTETLSYDTGSASQQYSEEKDGDVDYESEEYYDEEPIKFSHYVIEDDIAAGPFGKICVGQHQHSGETALMQFVEMSSEDYETGKLSIEKLGQFDSTYLMRQYAWGEAAGFLWAVYSYPRAGELFVYLRQIRRFPFEIAQLYIAEILDTTGYLHSIGHVFTNMGPEQLFLDRDGHVHISDFLLGTPQAYYTGTEEYTTPEFLTEQIDDYGSDWWRLGILLYEFTVGIPPFRSKETDDLFSKIRDQQTEVRFPPFLTKETKDLIRQLLVRDPERRLGARGDADEIRKHPFFDGIDWELLRDSSRPHPAPELILEKIREREEYESDEEEPEL